MTPIVFSSVMKMNPSFVAPFKVSAGFSVFIYGVILGGEIYCVICVPSCAANTLYWAYISIESQKVIWD